MDFIESTNKTKLSLESIYKKYSTPDGHGDKGSSHSYIPVYDQLLTRFREGSTVMEIGVAFGLSLRMWNEYFEKSTIIGVDKWDVECSEIMKNPSFNIIIEDATSEKLLNRLKGMKFDIIIDDGSHIPKDQIKTFLNLKSLMKPGGFYIIEDVLCIDQLANRYQILHSPCFIFDMRKIKNKNDDVLVVYKF